MGLFCVVGVWAGREDGDGNWVRFAHFGHGLGVGWDFWIRRLRGNDKVGKMAAVWELGSFRIFWLLGVGFWVLALWNWVRFAGLGLPRAGIGFVSRNCTPTDRGEIRNLRDLGSFRINMGGRDTWYAGIGFVLRILAWESGEDGGGAGKWVCFA